MAAKKTVTKPVILNETGQDIVTAINALKEVLKAGLSNVYVVSGATPYSVGWLSATNGGAPISPNDTTLYLVVSTGDYKNHIYRFNNSLNQYEDIVSAAEFDNATTTKDGKMSKEDKAFIESAKKYAAIYQDSATLVAGNTVVSFTDDTINSDCIVEVFTNSGIQYNSFSISNHTITINFDTQEEDVTVKVRWS